MHTAQHHVVSALIGERAHSLTVGAPVAIFSGYSNRQIGTGTVIRVLQRWVMVESSCWAVPVQFRTSVPLRGHRIAGGMAEHLNEWIKVPTGDASDVEALL